MIETTISLPDNDIIIIEINGKKYAIENHFSLALCEKYINECKDGTVCRKAFICAVYEMSKLRFHDDIDMVCTLDSSEFEDIDESQLLIALYAVINKDEDLLRHFNDINDDDLYHKFYLALIMQMSQVGKSISRIINETLFPIVPSVPKFSGLDNLSFLLPQMHIPDIYIPKIQVPDIIFPKFEPFAKSILNVPSLFPDSHWDIVKNLTTSLNNIIPHNTYIEALTNMSEVAAAFSKVLQNEMIASTQVLSLLARELSSSVVANMMPVYDLMASIRFDFTNLSPITLKYHETMKKFGWWYLCDIEIDLIEEIHMNRQNLCKDDVDKMLCDYYRKDRCLKLKEMAKKWSDSQYFSDRKIDIHEIVVIHGKKYFNSSVSLIMIITEGIIRDFVKARIGDCKFRFKGVHKDFQCIIEDTQSMSIVEYEVALHMLSCVENIFNGQFDPNNPETTPDSKRDKRIHGQAFSKQTEVDSIKLLLQLNELHQIISIIENELSDIHN